MKNIFDYATKELSQDAFIRWLLENYDDPELSEYSKSFLRFLVGDENYEFDYLKTYAQVNKIDIKVEMYRNKNTENFDVLVIEDKTDSLEHKQLVKYDEAIKNWGVKGNIYRVFYKTSSIMDKDKEGIGLANCNSNKVGGDWISLDIDEIYEHFNNKPISSSQIYNHYVQHVERLYKDHHMISKDKTDKWNFTNWSTFFKENMDKHHPQIKYYTNNYRGMYESLILNFYIPNSKTKYLACATFEIIVRSDLIPFFHPSFHTFNSKNKYDWYWSINEVRDDVKEECKKELLELREHIENRKSNLLLRANTARSFAKINSTIKYSGKTADEVWKELDVWINEYISAVDSFVKRK